MAASALGCDEDQTRDIVNAPRPILVVGKSGQLARSLVDAAARRDIPLVALGRPDLDLRNPGTIDRLVGVTEPHAIVNAAAYTAVDKAETDAASAFAINRDGAALLAQAAATLGLPFVHISTDYVFDGRRISSYREDDPAAPLSVYGQSKLESEIVVQQACSWAHVLRTSWVYSAYGQNFVTTMLKLAQDRPMVQVVDDQHGAPTAAADIADAILRILTRPQPRSDGGLYHLAASGETSWYGFADAIFTSWARRGWRIPKLRRITTADYPHIAKRPANSRLDCSKIADALGIRLPDWRSSLETCLDALSASSSETSRC